MASPFRVFRKNQKTLMVLASVIAIFVFVLGDSLVSYVTGSKNARSGDDRDLRAVAVHWDGGSLTNRQLNDLVSRRRILNGFLKQVQMEGERGAYQAGVDPPPLRVQQLLGPETPQQGVEQHIVRMKLLANAARDAGMKVSDDTVVRYLDELGRKNVPRERMRAILSSMQMGGGRVSIDYVIDALREEMLANNYLKSQQFAFETVTPQQQWKDWLLVNDRVVIEAAAEPAATFLSEVKEPSEAELEAFFNTYKDREASPDLAFGTTELPSPVPGFKIPRKVDLQFVQASYDDFLTKAEAKVTDEDVAKYYEEHKKLFEKADTGLMEDAGKKKDDQKSETPVNKDGAKEGVNPAKPGDGEKKAGESESKKTSEPDAKETKPSAEPDKNTDGQPPAETKGQPANKEGKTGAGPETEKQSSYRANRLLGVFRLTAFEEKTEKSDASVEKADASADSNAEKGAEKPAPASSPPAPESKTAEAPEKPAAAPAAGSPATEAGSSAAPVTADSSKAASGSTAKPADNKPVEYQPLSEVKDVIRRQLAEGKVADQLTQLTGEIQTQLESEFNKWFNETLTAQAEKQSAPAPPKSLVDLAAIAQKNGLKESQTGPKSVLELREMPIGKSSIADSGRSLLSLLFLGHELDLYQPVTTVDLDGNRYVVMKMSDTPARVPTLAEVRNEVVRMWKNQKATELAVKHAEELAKKAQEAKSTLTNFFADNKDMKVVRTDPFAELTGGDVGLVNGQFQRQPFRLSQPDGIVAPGPDFMRRVFDLKDGQVGVALNHDHSIAYVIRIVEHQPGLNELRTAYLTEADTWPGMYSMTQNHVQEVASGLVRDIAARAHLSWDRVADKSAQEEQREGG